MIEIIPNWHPVFVHFTVALFSIAVLFFILGTALPNHKWRDQWLTVAHWNLWVGAAISLLTATAGWFAFNSVNHDTPSHAAMIEHRNLALITLAMFLPIAVWSLARYRAGKPVQVVFLAALLVAQGLLVSTAWHGAELVYRHGLGVMSLPKKEGDGHAHEHSDGAAHGQGSGTIPADMREPDALLHNESDGHAHDEPAAPSHGVHGNTNTENAGATTPMKKPRDHVDDPARPHTH